MADEEILDPGVEELTSQEDVPDLEEITPPEGEEDGAVSGEEVTEEEEQELTREQLLWIAEQQRKQIEEEARKRHNELAYKMRVTAKEKKQLERKLDELQQTLIGKHGDHEEEEEELPDKEANPGGYLIAKIEQLERRLAKKDEESQVEQKIKGHLGELMSAREMAVQFRAANPEAYDAALVHLVNVTREELMEDFPDLEDTELNQLMARGIAGKMVEWKNRGMNPGEQLVKMALRRGFTWQQQAPAAPQKAKPSADQQVRMQQARRQKAGSIAGVPGTPPGGRLNLNKALSMSEEEYVQDKNISWKDIVKLKGIPG